MGPLEGVEQAPVGGAAHVQPVVQAVKDAVEGLADELDAPGVVVGGNAILGDEHRRTGGGGGPAHVAPIACGQNS